MTQADKKNRIVITVDGLAGSGKSTLARKLAARIGFIHLNTGLLYRAVGLVTLRSKLVDSPERIAAVLAQHEIQLRRSGDKVGVFLDEVEVTAQLNRPEVSEATSIASAMAEVRNALLTHQRSAFPGENLVAEGRDLGTIIFPDAPLKFFIIANTETRIQRRLKQLYGAEILDDQTKRQAVESEINREITERDKRDSERDVAPTKAAEDAVVIDNSTEALEETVEKMRLEVQKRGLA